MFNFYGKAKCIRIVYEGASHEIVLFEDVEGSKIVVHIQKDYEKYDLIKSGEWIMAKFGAKAMSRINRRGEVFFNSMIIPVKIRELTGKELENLKEEIIYHEKEVEKLEKAKEENKGEMLEIAKILMEDEKEEFEAYMKGEF